MTQSIKAADSGYEISCAPLPPSLRVKVARDSAAVQVDDVFAHDRHVSVSPRPVCPLLWQKEREKEREREGERERETLGDCCAASAFSFYFHSLALLSRERHFLAPSCKIHTEGS